MSTRGTVTIHGPEERRPRAKPGEAPRYLRDVVLLYEGDDCLIWPYARTGAGYGHLSIDGENILVSRIACEAEHGLSPTPWHDAAHSCGNGHLACCTRKHVRWATPKENQQDMVLHGKSQQGERQHAAKLTDDSVRFIRASKQTNTELAEKFGTSRAAIISARKGKTWRHVQ